MSDVLLKQLNAFNPARRREALEALWDGAQQGTIEVAAETRAVNLHCHTFYSYNGYGDSPSAVAWKAKAVGLAAIGIVDFDVLDGVREFLEACALLEIRACAGIETRVFVEPLADRVINSPGEPGIAYHMGSGFTADCDTSAAWVGSLKSTARDRTVGIVDRVNAFAREVALDFEGDVLPLTPNGNATERHVCIAYETKARECLAKDAERHAYWSEKLGTPPETISELEADPPLMHALIRSKLMKQGGVGYVKPEGPDFPSLTDMNDHVRGAGAFPVMAWLDGTSDGEADPGALLDMHLEAGIEAVNIIPDRNWNIADADARRAKVEKLHAFVAAAEVRDLPILVGTECNAHGQRFVDDFSVPEMEPLVEPAYDAALLMYAHTKLAPHGIGYESDWLRDRFATRPRRFELFKQLGAHLDSPEDLYNRQGFEAARAMVDSLFRGE